MQTELESISHNDNTVKVTLHARRDSKFRSLDRTATKHFETWQHSNYRRLGYKSCEIVMSERKDSNVEGMYFYTLVFRLVY